MAFIPWISCLILASALSRFALAQIPSYSYAVAGNTGNSSNALTISINVPASSKDELFFNVTGPAMTWVGFGWGNTMAGALMFILYPSGDQKNVTVSPRLATGNTMPLYTSATTVTVLNGSAYDGNSYNVGFHCSGCRSWNGGTLDVTSQNQPILWAVAEGQQPISSDNQNIPIMQHTSYGTGNVNLVQATGLGGVPTNSTPAQTSYSSGGIDGGPGPGIHAFIMCVSFIVLLPLGYLLLRVFEKVWLHYVCQSVASFGIVVGSIGGIVLSRKDNLHPKMNAPHQIVGLVVLFLVLFTWTAGLLGHLRFRKTKLPSLPGKAHRILGPTTISLGLVNGALGFLFASHGAHSIVAYIVVVALMILFVTAVIYFKRRRSQRKAAMNTPAAQNFRQGQMEPQYAGVVPGEGQRIPLQHYGSYNAESQPEYGAPPYEAAGYYAPPPRM